MLSVGSADTGAREPQPQPLWTLAALVDAGWGTLTHAERWTILRDLEAALAAGVGVPPQTTDLVSAPHREREDARAWLVYCGAHTHVSLVSDGDQGECGTEFVYVDDDPVEPRQYVHCPHCGAECFVVREPASEASAAEGRNPNPEPAGVGEARPAEPPQEPSDGFDLRGGRLL